MKEGSSHCEGRSDLDVGASVTVLCRSLKMLAAPGLYVKAYTFLVSLKIASLTNAVSQTAIKLHALLFSTG